VSRSPPRLPGPSAPSCADVNVKWPNAPNEPCKVRKTLDIGEGNPWKSRTDPLTMTQPITIAHVSRAIQSFLEPCLAEGWDDTGEIAFFIANQLSAQPDPNNLRRWWITLPSVDGSDPDDGELDEGQSATRLRRPRRHSCALARGRCEGLRRRPFSHPAAEDIRRRSAISTTWHKSATGSR